MEGHTINCSKCGGTLDVPEGLNSVFCVYCGNKNLITDILEIPGLTLLCLKCEAKNKDENQYCHKCGYILQYICPYCSVLHPLNKKHCPKTGHKLDIKSVLYEDGKNALHHEVEKGQVEAVKTLISLGLDLNLKDVKGITPLAIATFTKNLELIKILLSHGADINAQSNFGLAIVDIAISKGYKDLVEFLLENNACPCLGLNMAIVRDFKEIFELLLSKGADVNVEDPDENTPLHVAILEANTNMVISLLSHGADVNKVNKKTGLTPLMLAVNLNTEEATIVDYLLSYKADHNVIDHYGETPLHIAIKQSKYYVAQVLLNHKVDINIRNASEETPLHTAIKYSIDGIEFLVEHSEHEIDINAKDKYGNTPLHTAAANFTVNYRDGRISLYSLVEYMIKHGADVNAKNQDGNTPLHVATNCGNLRDNVSNFQIVEVLRRNGASVFTKNNNGETPFSGLKPDVRKEYIARTGQGNSGCFIATACYGSPNCQEIIVLQRFRDEYLLKSILGSIFVFLYYQTSPPIASFIGEREGLRSFIRKYVIQPIVNVLYKHLGYF